MGEERLVEIQNYVLRFQRQLANIEEGFNIEHNGADYDFTCNFIDRYRSNIIWTMQCKL